MKHKEESTHQTANGLARDTHKTTATARNTSKREELQGYVLAGAGLLLFTFALTGFTWLKWMTVVGSLALTVYGAYKANLFEKAYHYFQSLRK